MRNPANAPSGVTLAYGTVAGSIKVTFTGSTAVGKAISAAASGTLHQPEVLTKQARRMLADARVRRLAREFACQWLHIYDFDTLDEKSERHFPEFAESALRTRSSTRSAWKPRSRASINSSPPLAIVALPGSTAMLNRLTG